MSEIFSANDLYNATKAKECDTYTCCEILRHFLPEAMNGFFRHIPPSVVVKQIKEITIDDRRYWSLMSVWFNGRPCMILQSAGREGRDHRVRFITNAKVFAEMCIAILKEELRRNGTEDLIESHIAIEDLSSFYGYKLKKRDLE